MSLNLFIVKVINVKKVDNTVEGPRNYLKEQQIGERLRLFALNVGHATSRSVINAIFTEISHI